MGVTAAHQLSSLYIDTDVTASTTVGGVFSKTIRVGTEVLKENSSGSLYPEVASVVAVSPNAQLTTSHVKEVFDVLGTRALCITSAINTGVHLWARRLDCAGISESDNHEYTFRNGIMIPMAMVCDHRGNAAVDISIFGIETASLASLIITDSEPVLYDTTVNKDRWTLYYATVDGTAVTHMRNVSVDFGNAPVLESADGDTAPTFASVQETAPVVTFRGIDPVGWSGIVGITGAAAEHANTEIYLKKRGVAVGTAEHIKMTINGLAYMQTAFDATGNQTGETDLIVEGTEDASGTAPLTLDTASAIS